MFAIIFIKLLTPNYLLSQRQSSKHRLGLTLPSVWVTCYLMTEGTRYSLGNGP